MLGRVRLLWQLTICFILVTVLSLAAFSWYLFRAFTDFHLDSTSEHLLARARLIEDRLPEDPKPEDYAAVDTLCKELGAATSTRITVILTSGLVIGDSLRDPKQMENHADRPEILESQATGFGRSIRFSTTIRTDLLYVAIPLGKADRSSGTVRTSVSMASLYEALQDMVVHITLGGLLVAILACSLAVLISRRITHPVQQMCLGAERFSKGELTTRLEVPRSEELGALARTLNQMAEQLNDRMRTVENQRNEMSAMLASMVEGVLAVDLEERLLSFNRAAAQLFDLDQTALGRSIQEVIRHAGFLRLVSKTLSGAESVSEELSIQGSKERWLQAHGTMLRDGQGNAIGVLVVLNDVTTLRRLETVRRDFVANVSHELRTPITSIKGFVETLIEGDLADAEETRRFLGIVARQSDRLNAIIDDLVTLSRVEQDERQARVALERGPIRPVLSEALHICQVLARNKGVNLELDCPADATASVNASLLEQAVMNLVDNAVKYSESGSTVHVSARLENGGWAICVQDQGCGIESRHLSRLFERFYRVDKARSRKIGGTGLGLAIVKHIAQAHGGQVDVDSTPGKGSTFTIHLPRGPAEEMNER